MKILRDDHDPQVTVRVISILEHIMEEAERKGTSDVRPHHSLLKGEQERALEVATILGLPLPKVRQAFETTTRLDEAGEEKTIRWAVLAHEVNEATMKRIKALGMRLHICVEQVHTSRGRR